MAKIFPACFIGVFGVIGLLTLWLLWFGVTGFHEPPLFYKLFGSCIASAFILFGFGGAYGILTGTDRLMTPRSLHSLRSQLDALRPRKGSYACKQCGARIDNAEVSPNGDIKCQYCGSWFNIHHD